MTKLSLDPQTISIIYLQFNLEDPQVSATELNRTLPSILNLMTLPADIFHLILMKNNHIHLLSHLE
jgi:hypothetical protein